MGELASERSCAAPDTAIQLAAMAPLPRCQATLLSASHSRHLELEHCFDLPFELARGGTTLGARALLAGKHIDHR